MPSLTLADIVDMGDDGDDDGDDAGEQDESPEEPHTVESPPASSSSRPMSSAVSDPRIRHRNEEVGWDPSARLSVPTDRGLGVSC